MWSGIEGIGPTVHEVGVGSEVVVAMIGVVSCEWAGRGD